MPTILVLEGRYYSPADEEHFFSWLRSIPGVRRITGTKAGLLVVLGTAAPSEQTLRELIALHWRYKLPMKELARFRNPRNEMWFADPKMFWYEAVHGTNAVSPDVEARLCELRELGATPIAAIKALHAEYGFGLAEAKRRFSISPAWAAEQAAADRLHGQIIRTLGRKSLRKRTSAA